MDDITKMLKYAMGFPVVVSVIVTIILMHYLSTQMR